MFQALVLLFLLQIEEISRLQEYGLWLIFPFEIVLFSWIETQNPYQMEKTQKF